MIYRKLICFLVVLWVVNPVHAQTIALKTAPKVSKKKLEKNFMLGICYNASNSTNQKSIGGTIRTPVEYRRDWQFQHQPSATMGVSFKNQLSEWFATQIELNLLLARQKATVDEAISFNNNTYTTVGTIQFSTLYVNIPILFSITLEKSSDLEFGVILVTKVQNWGSQNLIKTVFSEQADCNGCNVNPNPIVVYTPEKSLYISNEPKLYTHTLGAFVGVNYQFNKNKAVRLRWERETGHSIDFTDLYQSRLSLSFLFKWQ